jgi:hypothetical protein
MSKRKERREATLACQFRLSSASATQLIYALMVWPWRVAESCTFQQ